jgi:hypothetical protein
MLFNEQRILSPSCLPISPHSHHAYHDSPIIGYSQKKIKSIVKIYLKPTLRHLFLVLILTLPNGMLNRLPEILNTNLPYTELSS